MKQFFWGFFQYFVSHPSRNVNQNTRKPFFKYAPPEIPVLSAPDKTLSVGHVRLPWRHPTALHADLDGNNNPNNPNQPYQLKPTLTNPNNPNQP